jgi:Tfp pilus assembly protein PilV
MKAIKNQKGYFLIDVLMVMVIILIGILSIAQMIIMSTKTAAANDDYTKAMQIASARLEGLTTITANDWDTLNPTDNFQTIETMINAIANRATKTTLAHRFLTLSNPAITDSRFARITEVRLSSPPGMDKPLAEVKVSISWSSGTPQRVQVSGFYIIDP